jgi:hypothetical protein
MRAVQLRVPMCAPCANLTMCARVNLNFTDTHINKNGPVYIKESAHCFKAGSVSGD